MPRPEVRRVATRPVPAVVAATLLAALLAAPLHVAVPTAGAALARSTTSRASTPLDWRDCGGGFECSSLEVPVDYAAPHGERVAIAVIRKPATSPAARRRSLVLNFGGPGDPGTETVRRAYETIPDSIRAAFDIVSFDPRGTGSSRPLDCVDDATFERLWSEDGTPADDADLPAYYEGRVASVDVVASCIASQGDWLRHVGTRNVARDLDRLRVALDDRRLTFVGYSYGTVLGAVYAQEFPDLVRALVLDSAVDLSETGAARLAGNTAGFEHALDTYLADCAADARCDFHSDGDPRGALTRLRDRFEAGLTVPTGDGRAVGVGEFHVALLAAFYSRSTWPALSRGLRDATRGNGHYLGLLSDAYAGRRDDGTYTNFQEALGLIVCADQRAPRPTFDEYVTQYHELTARFPFFGPVLGASPAGCDHRLPVPAASEALGDVEAKDAPPILIVGTTHDPATPYRGAQDLQRRIRRSRILTIDDTQHGGFAEGNTCVDITVSAYLLHRTLPDRGATCDA